MVLLASMLAGGMFMKWLLGKNRGAEFPSLESIIQLQDHWNTIPLIDILATEEKSCPPTHPHSVFETVWQANQDQGIRVCGKRGGDPFWKAIRINKYGNCPGRMWHCGK